MEIDEKIIDLQKYTDKVEELQNLNKDYEQKIFELKV